MPAAALNAFHIIYLRHVLEESGVSEEDTHTYSIRVNIHPLPRTAEGQVRARVYSILYSWKKRLHLLFYV